MMKEAFLHYIWKNTLFKSSEFTTQDGKIVEIVAPGWQNKDAGPDFFNARIIIDGVMWVGNVEIHLRSSDWYRHGHHKDAAYNNVILSVVANHDVRILNNREEEVTCLVLDCAEPLYAEYLFLKEAKRQPACFRRLEVIDDGWFYMNIQHLAIERLERKTNDIRDILEQTGGDWNETLYRLLCKYWAGNVNRDPFYQLALMLPYKILLRYANNLLQLEALLFGVSGLLAVSGKDDYTTQLKEEYAFLRKKHQLSEMDPSQWKFMRIRPDAFPTIRIALLASFLSRIERFVATIPEVATLKELKVRFFTEASVYWNTHYVFNKTTPEKVKRMGEVMCKTLIINAVIPFVFLYDQCRGDKSIEQKAIAWLEEEKAEDNFIVKIWQECGFSFDSALQTQALIQLYREYCEKRKCLTCRIGREVLRSSME